MIDRSAPSFSFNRRQALVSVSISAAAFAAGIGAPFASALPAAVLPEILGPDDTDMTGHVPAYAAPIGFGRPSLVAAASFADPHDLIFV